MDAATSHFTDRMGLLFEADGQPPIAGRIFGYLMVSDDPRSLDHLAEALDVSKASVSTNARRLAGQGVLERVRGRLRGYEGGYAYMVDAIGAAVERWERSAGSGGRAAPVAREGKR